MDRRFGFEIFDVVEGQEEIQLTLKRLDRVRDLRLRRDAATLNFDHGHALSGCFDHSVPVDAHGS